MLRIYRHKKNLLQQTLVESCLYLKSEQQSYLYSSFQLGGFESSGTENLLMHKSFQRRSSFAAYLEQEALRVKDWEEVAYKAHWSRRDKYLDAEQSDCNLSKSRASSKLEAMRCTQCTGKYKKLCRVVDGGTFNVCKYDGWTITALEAFLNLCTIQTPKITSNPNFFNVHQVTRAQNWWPHWFLWYEIWSSTSKTFGARSLSCSFVTFLTSTFSGRSIKQNGSNVAPTEAKTSSRGIRRIC
jgi:hypothetical protein